MDYKEVTGDLAEKVSIVEGKGDVLMITWNQSQGRPHGWEWDNKGGHMVGKGPPDRGQENGHGLRGEGAEPRGPAWGPEGGRAVSRRSTHSSRGRRRQEEDGNTPQEEQEQCRRRHPPNT
ncbi:uncharacterized protein UHOD_11241 [Ustilago sp. UG-2017b]|nr:uncharacterized protein UHOD_11241 [Ustilago sp. UG-2017b]